MPGSIVVSLIFLLIPLTLLQRCGAADSITAYELQSKNCSSSGNFSSGGGIYEMNLRQFLATLPSNVINNRGFFNGSVGSTNAVFGMAMCQADMPWPDHCESCLQAATAEAPKACPSSYNASVAYRGCVLRYWDTPVRADAIDNIFNNIAFYTQDHAVWVPDTTALNQTRTDLFNDLSSQVFTSPLMIASGNRTFNSTHNLYGLAQCNRDLPKELCSYYIWGVVGLIPVLASDAQSSEGLSITGYAYYIRYDLTPFQVYVPDNSSGPTETAKDVVQYKDCSSSGNVSTSSDPYQLNLRQFLDALPSNAINNSGFFNGTTGSENKVFGTAMCQADIPWPDQCKSCLQAASAGAPKACPASNNASVAYQGCVLRYSDMPILAAADDNSIAFYTQNNAASVPDTTAFQQTRQDLLTDLAGAAVISPMMIGSGNREFNSTHKLYGLAQCNKDLPRELCSRYIKSVALKLATDVQWSEGVAMTGFNFYIRYDLTPFQVYVPSNLSETARRQSAKGGSIRGEIVGIAVAVSIILFMLVIYMLMRHYQQKRKTAKIQKLTGLTEFSYRAIKNGTMNFSEKNKLGQGGFGQVYKGRLRLADGNEKDVAIKRVTNQDAAKQLMGELETLAKLRHKNVLRLVGFCIKGKKLFVCNEMLSNGSLDTHLHGQAPLSWSTRYEIIRGVCDGLHYLHGACNNTIWHMDIKPDNILLDDQMKPKIADFGLSRVFENKNKNNTQTMNVIGSRGYMAPEFVKDGRVGCECDIYSLGILIMVIVMGKGPDGTELCGTAYINEIHQLFDASNPQQLMKYACLGVCDKLEAVKKCLVLAFDCVKEKPEARPTTKEICARLNITASDTTEVEVEVN